MSDRAVDSCILAKWVIAEPDSPQALEIFRRTAQARGRIVVLDLALVEVTNVSWKRFHRGLATVEQTDAMFSELRGLPCSVVPASDYLERSLVIARAYRRSVYDALFVALSEGLELDGITSDEPLYQAVRADFPNIRLLRDWNVQDVGDLP